LQVTFELTVPPNFVHSPSVSGVILFVFAAVGAGGPAFFTTAQAGPLLIGEQTIAKTANNVSKLFMHPPTSYLW
jgi:hypothetical protein